MNTTFFHDSTIIQYNNKYYSSGQLNNDKIEEYRKYFGDISVAVKVSNTFNDKIVNCDNEFKDLNVIKIKNNYSDVFKLVKEQVIKSDFAIIRLPSVIGSVACHYVRKYNKPYFIELVGCPRDALWYHGGIKHKLLLPLMYFITKREVKKSNYTIYVTEKFLQKRYKTTGESLGCSDVQVKANNNEIINIRNKKIDQIDKNYIYKIGLIGALDLNYKGHETALKALANIKDEINFELHFLGRGKGEKWVNLAKKLGVVDKVYFDEIIPHYKIFDWFDSIDVFLNPSLTEGLPRALIEAMSRGCLCFGTRVGGIPELLDNECIVKKKDFRTLSYKILSILNNKEKYKKVIQNNYYKSKLFTLDLLLEKRSIFYKEILDNYINRR